MTRMPTFLQRPVEQQCPVILDFPSRDFRLANPLIREHIGRLSIQVGGDDNGETGRHISEVRWCIHWNSLVRRVLEVGHARRHEPYRQMIAIIQFLISREAISKVGGK